MLVVGGNSKREVRLQLHEIAERQQRLVGVRRGTRRQLSELVQFVAEKKVWLLRFYPSFFYSL